MQNFKIMVWCFIKRQNKVSNADCVYIMFQKLIIIIYWRKYLLLFDKIMFIFIKVKSSMARSHPVENLYYHRIWVNYQLLAVMLLKLPNGLLPVAVDHSHLRTVASEPEDPIDWQLTPPLTGQYPLSSALAWWKWGLQMTRQAEASGRGTRHTSSNWLETSECPMTCISWVKDIRSKKLHVHMFV